MKLAEIAVKYSEKQKSFNIHLKVIRFRESVRSPQNFFQHTEENAKRVFIHFTW